MNIMVLAKVNRECASLGADLTSTDMSEGYVTYSKSKASSVMHGTEENNVLPSQTINSDDKEGNLAGTVTTLSLLYPPTDNSASQNLSWSSIKMKYYYHHTHCNFLDYFNDPIPTDEVIYTSHIHFQYNKIEGTYPEFIGNPIGTVFIAVKRDHTFLLIQRSNNLICQVVQLIVGH